MTRLTDTGLKQELDAEVERRIADVHGLLEREAADAGVKIAEKTEDAAPRLLREAVNRRSFLRSGATVISAAAIASTLNMSMIRSAEAQSHGRYKRKVPCPYGDPVPTLDEVTGLPLIGLPPGFRYWSHGWTGDPIFPDLPNGLLTPAMHDGMGVRDFAGRVFQVSNEHRMVTSRLMFALSYWLTGTVNVPLRGSEPATETVVSEGALTATSVGVAGSHRLT